MANETIKGIPATGRDHAPNMAPVDQTPSMATRLRQLLYGDDVAILMEAHNGLSAKIVGQGGFAGIWASSLTVSAALGLRDSNEASWTQVLEVLEFMADSADVPILMDGDTGYGNFNNVRRLVTKLGQRGIAGVCIEDKVFPKTNSLIDGRQELVSIGEFTGKIKAAKDSRRDADFCVIARTEALIANLGMEEAIDRAHAYHEAGADAVLLHSRRHNGDEIFRFMSKWDDSCPIVIVPTTYYRTPFAEYGKANIAMVIWANHMLRVSIAAMRTACQKIHGQRTPIGIESDMATVGDIFDLVGNRELARAEKEYLAPEAGRSAVILAASRGAQLGELTQDRPKCMIDVRGEPILHRLVATFHKCGIAPIHAVCGYRANQVDVEGCTVIVNDDYADNGEAASLACAMPALEGPCLVSYGDIVFRRFILEAMLAAKGDIILAVDGLAAGQDHRQYQRKRDFVHVSRSFRGDYLEEQKPARLQAISHTLEPDNVSGEWMGIAVFSDQGTRALRAAIERREKDHRLKEANMLDLCTDLMESGQSINVVYFAGNWLDVDDLGDLAKARNFA